MDFFLDKVSKKKLVKVFERKIVNLVGAYQINPSFLEQPLRDHEEIYFDLGPNLRVEAKIRTIEEDNVTKTSTWFGRVYGDDKGFVILTKGESIFSGHIWAFNQHFSIRGLKHTDSKKSFEEIIYAVVAEKKGPGLKNDIAYINEAQRLGARRPVETPASPQPFESLANAPTTIDIMIAYTANANAAYASIATAIANDIAYSNEVLDRSCTKLRLRLVHTEQVVYNDTNVTSGVALDCLSNKTDGCLDAVHTSRDTNGADLLQIWIEPTNPDVCGLAGLYSPYFNIPAESTTYSLKIASCDANTTIHEVGHNLGSHHDLYSEEVPENITTPYTPGYGHIDANTGYLTTMAYDNFCTNTEINCELVPYFSNPRILYKGVPLGIPHKADSAYVIVKHKSTMAAIRAEATAAPTPSFSLCEEVNEKSSSELTEGCFIASWVYQSPNAPDVIRLRVWRDKTLRLLPMGEWIIKTYYSYSPGLVHYLENEFPGGKWIKEKIRDLLKTSFKFFLFVDSFFSKKSSHKR